MGDFFKPWRRKMGVVTLLMALALMGAWINCLRSENVISGYTQDRYSERWIDSHGAIVLERIQSDRRVVFDPVSPTVIMVAHQGLSPCCRFKHNANSEIPKKARVIVMSETKVVDKQNPVTEIPPPKNMSSVKRVEDQVVEWKWKWLVFGYGVSDSPPLGRHVDNDGPVLRMTVWSFPYWFFVIPLTLFSAYLLLTKPHRARKFVQWTPHAENH